MATLESEIRDFIAGERKEVTIDAKVLHKVKICSTRVEFFTKFGKFAVVTK